MDRKRLATRKQGRRPRQGHEFQARDGNLQPEADKKQNDKEVADIDDLGDDVDVVGKRGQADPGDERAHFPRQPHRSGHPADEKAPGNGRDQQQFWDLGHEGEDLGQHEAAGQQAQHDKSGSLGKGQRQDQHLGVEQIGLNRQKKDGPNVLEDENAKGDAPRQGREFELVVEQLDHDHGAAKRHGHGLAETGFARQWLLVHDVRIEPGQLLDALRRSRVGLGEIRSAGDKAGIHAAQHERQAGGIIPGPMQDAHRRLVGFVFVGSCTRC